MLDLMDPKTLQAARDAAGLSRAELASRAGVNEATIWRIENGKLDPKVTATWSRIVTALRTCRKVRRGAQ